MRPSEAHHVRLSHMFLQGIIALFILLWIYTGLNKILSYEDTKFQMGRSPFIAPISNFLAWSIPFAEIAIAFLLVFRKSRLVGLFASFILMLLFTGYVYIMLNHSYYLPCSCGGVLSALSWQDHLIFNGVFTILALIGIILQTKLNQTERHKTRFASQT